MPDDTDGDTGKDIGLLSSRLVVLLLLFGVLGVLGLPLLWISRAFSTREKVLWSLGVTLYTVILLGLASAAVWMAWQAIQA